MHGKKYFTCDFQSNQIKYAIKTDVKKKKKDWKRRDQPWLCRFVCLPFSTYACYTLIFISETF